MDDAAPRLSLAFELEAQIGPAVEFIKKIWGAE